MLLADVYQVLNPDDRVVLGDEFSLASQAAEHIWGPCDLFVGWLVKDVNKATQNCRLIFRRRIVRDEVQV